MVPAAKVKVSQKVTAFETGKHHYTGWLIEDLQWLIKISTEKGRTSSPTLKKTLSNEGPFFSWLPGSFIPSVEMWGIAEAGKLVSWCL